MTRITLTIFLLIVVLMVHGCGDEPVITEDADVMLAPSFDDTITIMSGPPCTGEVYPKSCTYLTCVYCAPRDNDFRYSISLFLLLSIP